MARCSDVLSRVGRAKERLFTQAIPLLDIRDCGRKR